MTPLHLWPIAVSDHALERAQERFRGVSTQLLEPVIRREVRAALKADRWARRLPSGFRIARDTRVQGGLLCAWNEPADRAYLIAKERDVSGRHKLVVVTAVVSYQAWLAAGDAA